MSWIKWGILFSAVLLRVSAEQQPSRSGSRRLYVQPAPAAADGPVSGQHGAYSLELHAKLAGQVGTRRLRNPAAPELSQRRSRHAQSPMPSGVNVCGGQCCHGWSETQGSQRCTKPNCIPQCQNGGLCLRPQLCICKPGSTGKACEEKTVDTYPFPAPPENGVNNGQTNGHNIVPQRPIPQQVPPDGFASSLLSNNMAPVKLAVKSAPHHVQPQYIQQHIQQRIQTIHPGQMKQHVRKQLKYYHSHSTHAEMQGHSQNNRPVPMRVGHSSIHAVGNHTGRIKVVFTPTICKLTCIGGKCQNNCKLGNTTTIISENGHATDTLTAPNFRVVVCHLPCINGGKCSARDKCQCPPSFTGKFCQLPVQDGHQQTSDGNSQTQVYSTHTLPLSYDNGQGTVFNPSIVNVHIKHPPEASVQIHQVSHVDNYHNGRHHLKGFQSSFSSSSVVFPSQHGYQVSQYQQFTHKNTLGRCFQETKGNQCGKALSGLIKQEQCCGTFGTSWGFHKCLKCPNKPYLDECQIHGVCPNGTCLNTIGSYRCKCNPGFVPDPTLTTCISSTPVAQLEKGSCFRLISSGQQCLHPVMAQLSKELCCCSVGKAWGPHCVKCPPPGTAKFRELCPGGLGYTVLPNPPVSKPVTISQKLTDLQTPLTLPTTERPVEPFGQTEEIIPEIVEKTSSPLPVEILPTNANQDIGPTQSAEVNECQISPYICGHGICYNTAESYPCHCDEGYHLDDGRSTCVDVNECANDAHLCSPHGKCLNTEGSYQCVCDSGFTARMDTPSCEDIDECGLNVTLCGPHGFCENRVGSFRCLCYQGYKESQNGQMCVASPVERKDCYYDLNNENLCESVLTSHVTLQECCCTLGAGWGDNCEVHPCPVSGTDQFDQMCQSGKGYILPEDLLPHDVPSAEDYRDADECVLFREEVCKGGFCLNTVGSYDCYCKTGQDYDVLKLECRDINECLDETSCVGGQCVNTDGSYICSCTHPMVLDPTSNHCVLIPEAAEKHEADDTDYLDICWQSVTETLTCTLPLASQTKTTYTECCCLYGQAWGMDCALCPSRNTEDFALTCSQDLGDGKQLYGHDALVATPDKVDPETTEQRSVLPFYDNKEYLHTAFEGLRATECGTPNGCQNGRCVRVQEGYTCDCFDGYTLDPSHMACVDVNECSELNGQTLCKNARCINTIGSYRCVCLPGFTASKKPNYCVAAATQQT